MNRCLKNLLTITALWLCLPSAGSAQQPTDSLKRELGKVLRDTMRIMILCDLSRDVGPKDPEQSLQYADKALTLSKAINWDRGIARSLAVLARASDRLNKFEDAVRYFKASLTYFAKLSDTVGLSKSYNNLGAMMVRRSMLVEGLQYLLQSANLKEQLGDIKGLASTLMNVAVVYTQTGEYDQANEQYLRALKVAEQTNYKDLRQSCHSNLGTNYYYQGCEEGCETATAKIKFELALKHHLAALQIRLEREDKDGIGFLWHNLSGDYRSLGDVIGDTALQRTYYQQAMDAEQNAIRLDEEAGVFVHLSLYKLGLARILLAVAKYNEAEPVLFDALRGFQADGTQADGRSKAELGLSELYAATGRNALALDHYKNYVALRDSLAGERKQGLIAELNAKYESERKDHQILVLNHNKSLQALRMKEQSALLLQHQLLAAQRHNELQAARQEQEIQALKIEKQALQLKDRDLTLERKTNLLSLAENEKTIQAATLKNTQKNRNMVIIALLGLFLFTGTVVYFSNQRRQLLLQHKITETELNLFRSQMNPHFMFNALNSIHSFVITNNTHKAASYLQKFSKLMRMILENSANSLITLEDDLQALDLYLELEAERLGHKFSYSISVEQDLDPRKVLVPPMMLQPFLENSVWHGMQQKEQDGRIQLHVSRDGSLLRCVITDNGNGLSAGKGNTTNQSKSYGILITRQRIENLNRTHKVNGYCNVLELSGKDQLPAGVKVEVGLPLELEG